MNPTPPEREAERFRTTFEQAPVGISHHAPDGQWLLANARFAEMLGYRPDELIAQSFQEITHPEDLAADLAGMQRALRGEIEQYSVEKRYICKDGSLLWTLLHASLVRDVDGRPAYFISVVQDISARKAAEAALRASEERFRRVFENSLDAILVADDDGHFLLANAAACELLGYDRKTLLTMKVTDLQSTGPTSAAEQWQTYRDKPAARGRSRFLRPDGEERLVEYGAVEIAPGEHVSILHDVTETQRQAAALRQSEQTLRTVVESIPIGIWLTDAQGRIRYGNAAGQQVWGGQALVGVADYGEYRGWWADTGKRIDAEEWALARALQGEVSLNELIEIETFDGERKRVLNSALPLRAEDGSILGAMVVIEDITPRYHAERETAISQQRLAAVVNAAADAIINTDGQGRIDSVNPAAEHLFGCDPDALAGHPIGDLMRTTSGGNPLSLMRLPSSQIRPSDRCDTAPSQTALSASPRELTARHTTGATFPVEVSISCVPHLDAITWIIRDVTERRRIQAALRKTERMAIIGNLAAGLAHDMTNLVTPIGLALSSLERDDLPEPGRRALQLIRYSAASLEELTRAVRKLVRDDPQSPPEPTELAAWWRNVQPLLEATLPPGVLLAADLRAAPPILVNPSQLTRAVLNLVVNAAEALVAGGRGGGHITVEGGPDPLGAVFVRVQDDGPGIAPVVLGRIFEPFFSTSARDFSSGLGLPMVKAFAIAAGGSVSIVTAANEGTAITLRLPIAGVDTAA